MALCDRHSLFAAEHYGLWTPDEQENYVQSAHNGSLDENCDRKRAQACPVTHQVQTEEHANVQSSFASEETPYNRGAQTSPEVDRLRTTERMCVKNSYRNRGVRAVRVLDRVDTEQHVCARDALKNHRGAVSSVEREVWVPCASRRCGSAFAATPYYVRNG